MKEDSGTRASLSSESSCKAGEGVGGGESFDRSGTWQVLKVGECFLQARSLPWPRDNERGAFQARGQMSGQDSEVPMPSCGNSSERAHSPEHKHVDFLTFVNYRYAR